MVFFKYMLLLSTFLLFDQGQELKAPDFKFTLDDGTMKNLSDYEGEVVYLSFWASWCAPCLSNYKKYHEVRTKLQEMGVVLLNVSIDDTKGKWKKSLDKHIVINGVNAHASDLDFVKNNYELSSIPLYEILNKKGEFVYLSETYPRDIYADFQRWLEE